ncbi:hypothetical protein M514_17905, partial [Trichuris suis]
MFWPHNAKLWFAQAEAQFVLSRITASSTKFYHTIASLNETVASEVEDLLEPQGDHPYEHLKQKLLKRFATTEEQCFRALTDDSPLGDRRPKQLLREMRHAAAGVVDVDSSFFRQLFLHRLPPNVQLVLKAFRTAIAGPSKPLVQALKRGAGMHCSREVRQLDYITSFTSDVRHIKGKNNAVADALSRVSVHALSSILDSADLKVLAAEQVGDAELQQMQNSSTLRMTQVEVPHLNVTLWWCDLSHDRARPFVPASLRRKIFFTLHSPSHPGVRATRRLITQHYIWPAMNRDIAHMVRSCDMRQHTKIQRHTRAPPTVFHVPDRRFDHVHLDLVGPLPQCRGCSYLVTMVDRFTRWPEVVPIKDATAATVARAFLSTWIARFGVPAVVSTDQGKQFQSAFWHELALSLGVRLAQTTAYHPQSNGFVERLHRQLKCALTAHVQTSRSWVDALPLVLLVLRTAVKEDFRHAPAELVFGSPLRLPGVFFSQMSARRNVAEHSDELRVFFDSVRPAPTRRQRSRGWFVPKELHDFAGPSKPLVQALKRGAGMHCSREVRQLDYITSFTSDVRHIKGKNNAVADALSRVSVHALSSILDSADLKVLAAEQVGDAELQQMQNSSTLRMTQVEVPHLNVTLWWCDLSHDRARPFVPASLRRKIFFTLHSPSHPGVRATRRLITQHYIWPAMNRDIAHMVRSCDMRQHTKIQRHTRAPPAVFHLPDRRFDHVHLDLVGPLPQCRECSYLVTMVDRFTRWPEVVPIKDATAATVARAFLSTWIARFGVPAVVSTDQGKQFQSAFWHELALSLGVRLAQTTAYHPQSNGFVERLHRQLKCALTAHVQTSRSWVDALPLVLLVLRTAVKEDFRHAPAELVFGSPLRLPGVFFSQMSARRNVAEHSDELRVFFDSVRPAPTRRQRSRGWFVPKELHDCTHVFLRHDAPRPPLSPTFDGPYRVTARTAKTVTIMQNGKLKTVSIDRVKPAFIDPGFDAPKRQVHFPSAVEFIR